MSSGGKGQGARGKGTRAAARGRLTLAAAFLPLAACLLPLRAAPAQRPPGADTLPARAVAESLAVMRRINAQLRTDNNNAALWYRKGLIAWALYDRDHAHGDIAELDWTLLGRDADSSLRIALAIEPKNLRYKLSLGQYFLGTGLMSTRIQAYEHFQDALDMARKGRDASLRAEAAVEYGRVFWRRYDAIANAVTDSKESAAVRNLARRLGKDSSGAASTADSARSADADRSSTSYTRADLARARETLDQSVQNAGKGFSGEADYRQAEIYLREAYTALPAYPRAYPQLAMLLAERARWIELAGLARVHLQRHGADAWAWLSLGLAEYRMGNSIVARDAFERGLEFLHPDDRARLDRIERVMLPRDTASSRLLAGRWRAELGTEFWSLADPLWSRSDVDPRTEFLARVAYAELRWTVEELMKRGADSDRGNIYIRYGPPDRIATVDDLTRWSYDFARLEFVFRGAPTFGTTYFADVGSAGRVIDSVPALWDNLPTMRIDSIPVQVARFRAVRDSVDVWFAALPPVDAIARASDIAAPVRTDIWLVDAANVRVYHDSIPKTTAGARSFTHRIAYGNFVVRLEATSEGALMAAHATARVGAAADSATGFPPRGFGMSDVLLASRVSPRGSTAPRWNDFDVIPVVGEVPRNTDVSLLWENYDFGAREGRAEYAVAVTIRRAAPAAGNIAARIIGSFGNAVGRNTTPDQVEFLLDRTLPHAAALVDNITLSLGDTPAGRYEMRVVVTDRITGATTSRTTPLVIRE